MTDHSGTLIDLSISSQFQWALAIAVFWAVVIEVSTPPVVRWVLKQPWWPRAAPVQKKLVVNFGYPEGTTDLFPEGLTNAQLAELYGVVWIYVGTHFVCFLPMLPVLFLGWEEAGAVWRTGFVLGAIGDVGFDIYDWVKTTWKTWAPHNFMRVTGQAPGPMPFWVIMCLMHHPLAMTLVIPMNLHYAWLPAYHKIAVALLGAAAICFGLGQYKLTLDITSRSGFAAFKMIVISSGLVIIYTRAITWAVEVRSALDTFAELGDDTFYRAGAVAAGLMSLFNLAIINDGVSAMAKYALKPLPVTAEAQEEIVEEQANSPALGAVSPSLGRGMSRTFSRFKALEPKQKWKAAGQTTMAGLKMAKLKKAE